MLSGYRLKASSDRKKFLLEHLSVSVQRKCFSFRIPLFFICMGLFFSLIELENLPKKPPKNHITSGRQMHVVCYQIAQAAIGLSFLGCVRRLCHTQLTASWHLRNPWDMEIKEVCKDSSPRNKTHVTPSSLYNHIIVQDGFLDVPLQTWLKSESRAFLEGRRPSLCHLI